MTVTVSNFKVQCVICSYLKQWKSQEEMWAALLNEAICVWETRVSHVFQLCSLWLSKEQPARLCYATNGYICKSNTYIYIHSFIHSVICLTTGPTPLPKRYLHIVRSRASFFKWEYPLLSLRSSSSFLRLLPRLIYIYIYICKSYIWYKNYTII
jgi:hypothetical protein